MTRRFLGTGLLSLFYVPPTCLHQTGRHLKEETPSPHFRLGWRMEDHMVFPYQTGISLSPATAYNHAETLQIWFCILCPSADSCLCQHTPLSGQEKKEFPQVFIILFPLPAAALVHTYRTFRSYTWLLLSPASYGTRHYVLCSLELRNELEVGGMGSRGRIEIEQKEKERKNSDVNKHNGLSAFRGRGKACCCTAISDLQIKRLRVREIT